MSFSSILARGMQSVLAATFVIGVAFTGLCGMGTAAAAQGNKVPVFQIEVFPKVHDRPAVDEIEFEVKKGVRYFTIDVNSIFPWICEGEIQNVYADDIALASSGNTWHVRSNFNIYDVVVRYYVPSNHGYCSFIVKAFQ